MFLLPLSQLTRQARKLYAFRQKVGENNASQNFPPPTTTFTVNFDHALNRFNLFSLDKLMKETSDQAASNPPASSSIICDGKWRITSWNKKAAIQFGYKEKDVSRRLITDFILTPFADLESKPTLEELIVASKEHNSNNIKFHGIATHDDLSTFPVELIATETAKNDSYVVHIRDLVVRNRVVGSAYKEQVQIQVINDILKISLEPYLLKEELELILDYLLSLPQLNLLPKASIFLIEQDPGLLILKAHRGFSHSHQNTCATVKLNNCICGRAASSGKLQFVNSITELHNITPEKASPHGHYSVPIKKDNNVTGVMCFYVTEGVEFCQDTADLLSAVAEIIAAIIENQKMDLQLINLVNELRVSILNLREEKKYSESIIQGLNHGLIVADREGNIQKSNNVAQNILQPFESSIDGKKLHDLIGEDAAEKMISHKAGKSLKPSKNEIILSTDTEGEIILNFSTVPREDSKGNKVGIIISLTDISEIKYARKEMEKMNRLSTVAEIASAVAHEVRNPLAGIKIMAQSIEEDSTSTGVQHECATRITRQVDRLNQLLTEFFSYARPVVPRKKISSLTEILAETKPLIHNKLEQNKITLEETYPESLTPIIADPNQVQQVFLNLFLNAVDAIKQHGTIKIIAKELSKSKLTAIKKKNPGLLSGSKYLKVTFSDNGRGMDTETVDKVFEPFFTTKTTGSGLGMSIVYRTLKENDATIALESIEGKGTTYTMYFVTI